MRVRHLPAVVGTTTAGVRRADDPRPPPFGIRVEPLERRSARAPEPPPPPRRWAPWPRAPRLGRRPLRTSLAALVLVGVFAVPELAATRGDGQPVPPTLPAPSRTELDRAIARAEHYLDGLYKPLGTLGAVQSEYYGLPLRVFFPRYRRWVLAGAVRPGRCGPVDCSSLTQITKLESSYDTEAYEVVFATPARSDALRLRVSVDWRPDPEHYRITVTATGMADPAASADVWLDDVRLGAFAPRTAGAAWPAFQRTFPTTDASHLRSLRYTVRHATQEAWLYAMARGDQRRTDALARFMLGAQVVPGLDLRVTLFGLGKQYPPDLAYAHGLLVDAYADCRLELPATPAAYPYRSRACLLDVRPYLWAAKRDPFLPTLEALQALNRGDPPDRPYPDGAALLPDRTTTALATAGRLEGTFGRLGFGIPRCTPIGCDRARASGVRTFAFGALETLLAYRQGEVARRPWADGAARLAVMAQVGDDGVVYAAGGPAYRPALRGGFYSYWDRQLRFLRPEGVTQAAIDRLGMPAEYHGLVPTDSETTFDGYAFLVLYRCARYGFGCRP